MIHPGGRPGADDPFVVFIRDTDRDLRHARLADALVVWTDAGPADELCARMLTRYPGLTLVLAVGPADDITVSLRQGTTVTIRCVTSPTVTPVATFGGIARHLYARWLAGSTLSEFSGTELTMSPYDGIELAELPRQVPSAE